MSQPFDPYYTWLSIPPEEQPADYYRLLGVRRFESNEDVITNAADQRMSYIRTFQTGKRGKESQRILNELSAAQICLLNPDKRRAYDQQLRRHDAAKQQAAAPVPVPVPMQAVPVQTLPVQPLLVQQLPQARPMPSPQPLVAIDPLAQLASSPLRHVVIPKAAPAVPPWVWIAGAGTACALVFTVIGVAANAMRGPKTIAAVSVPLVSPQPATFQPPAPPPPPKPQPIPVPSNPVSANVEPAAATPLIVPAPVFPTPMPAEITAPPVQSPAPVVAKSEPEPGPAPSATAITPPPPASSPPEPAPAVTIADPVPVTPSMVMQRIPLQTVSMHQVQISPDGRLLSYGTTSGRQPEFEVLDLATGQVLWDKVVPHGWAFSQDMEWIALLRKEAMSEVLEIAPLRNPSGGGSSSSYMIERGYAAAFSADNRYVFVATGRNPPLAVKDRNNPLQQPSQFSTTLGEVRGLAVVEDALVLCSPSNGFEVMSVSNPIQRRRIEHGGNVFPLSLAAADGVPTLTFFHAKDAHVYRLGTEITRLLQPIPDIDSHHNVLAISPEGDLAVLRISLGVALYDLAQRRELTRLERERSQVTSAAISKGRTMLVTGGPNKMLVAWDLAALLRQRRWQVPTPVQWAKGGFPAPSEPKRTALASASRPQPNQPQFNQPQPNQPPPQPQYDVAAGKAAIAKLREVGIELPDEPEQVIQLNLERKQLQPEHAKALGALPRLHMLQMFNCPCAALVLKEMPVLPHVGHLYLGGSNITDADVVHLKKLPMLDQLDLGGTQVTSQGISELKSLPRLCGLIVPETCGREVLPRLAEIATLRRIYYVPRDVTDADLATFSGLKNLTELNLTQTQINGSGLKHLQELKSLKEIHLPPTIRASALPQLASFNLVNFHFPDDSTDADLVHLARMTNLKMIWTPPEMTDAGMRTLGTYPAIDMLFMEQSHRLTSAGLAPVVKLQNLRHLDLPKGVDDAGLIHVGKCQRLENLSLQQTLCTAAGLPSLATAPRLKTLKLGARFDDATFRHLKNLRALESITLHESSVTAKGLEQLRDSKQITALNFFQVPLGDPEVAALAQLSHLKRLMVQQHNLTPEQRATLQKALPNCSIIN